MYPAHTQPVAKWSSPSIGDQRATGWMSQQVRIIRGLSENQISSYHCHSSEEEEYSTVMEILQPKELTRFLLIALKNWQCLNPHQIFEKQPPTLSSQSNISEILQVW